MTIYKYMPATMTVSKDKRYRILYKCVVCNEKDKGSRRYTYIATRSGKILCRKCLFRLEREDVAFALGCEAVASPC